MNNEILNAKLPIMKGMVLAAGRGTRLRPLTNTRSKPMIPVVSKPLITYPLDSLVSAGISDIAIVVGENRMELEQGLGRNYGQAQLSFVQQDEPLGLAHAVKAASTFCADSDFMLLFCDNLFSAPLSGAVSDWQRLSAEHQDLGAMIHVIEVEDPRAFGVAEVEGDWVVRLEEKPAQPRSNLAVVGIDIFKPAIFKAIRRIKPSARGELEITDAIQELLHMGLRVYARRLEGFWYDTGTFSDLIDVLKPVMDQQDDYPRNGTTQGCRIEGQLELGAGSSLVDCQVTGPVIIGPGAAAVGCQLGPYVAVTAEAKLDGCRLDNAQVYPGTVLNGIQASGALIEGDNILSGDDSPYGATASSS